MQLEYEEPSYDRLRNEAIQRLGILPSQTKYYEISIEDKVEELKAQYRDEWEQQDRRITFGVCFSSVLANLINNRKQYNLKSGDHVINSIVESSVIRKFADEHDKDIYISALEDTPVEWVELNEDAIKFLQSIKPAI